MWPSSETAARLYDLANIGLIIGLVVGIVSTLLVVWMGNVKEEYLNRELAHSRERTASLEKQSGESKTAIAKANENAAQSLATAKQAEANLAGANYRAEEARADAAKAYARSDEAKVESAKSFERATEAQKHLAEANERAAQAEQKAAEAKLALEIFKAPRVISLQEQQLIISRVSKFTGQEYTVTTFWDLKEPLEFSNQLHHTLLTAGWKFIPPGEGGSFLLGGMAGVQVWVHPEADLSVKDAGNALVSALEEIGKASTLKLQNPKNAKDNKIHINIGTKP
jgi:multidrug efflux pump subunit AcrA (membrane-fusion protein)